jgi:hypothetical protein
VEITWIDREIYPIAIHISFNRNHINTIISDDGENVFNREIIEDYFYKLQEVANGIEKVNKKKIMIMVDLPRDEHGHYRGYGTVQYEKSYYGMKECKGILEKYPIIQFKVGKKNKNVEMKLTLHHKFQVSMSSSPSSSSSSSSSSCSPLSPSQLQYPPVVPQMPVYFPLTSFPNFFLCPPMYNNSSDNNSNNNSNNNCNNFYPPGG